MYILRTLSRKFSRLQWQLTLSHTLTTIVALLLLEILGALLIIWGISADPTANIVNMLETQASALASQHLLLPNSQKQLQDWLSYTIDPHANFVSYQGYIVLLDTQGTILAMQGQKTPALNTSMYTQLSLKGQAYLRKMLDATSRPQTIIYQENDTTFILIPVKSSDVPIKPADQSVQGAIVLKASSIHSDLSALFVLTTFFIIITVLFFIPCASLIGALFGTFIARGFIIRFRNLSGVVAQWGQGNFAVFSQDHSRDEIGQLAQYLNRMAEQLQHLLQSRQEFASIQERNRLARDLHDSIKQQLFAVALQISTAKAQLNDETHQASLQLQETQNQVWQIQQELTTLIQQLRPVAVEEQGLVLALQVYLVQWQANNGITATFQKEGEYILPWLVEDTFYRVAQEALSNVARHSHATGVHLFFFCYPEKSTLTIQDNGHGFDLEQHRGRGMGLQSMRERLLHIGGLLSIESNKNGTSIRAFYQPEKEVE